MGFLHEGHLSLVRRAKAECASVGVSIFINPTQFGPTDLVWTPEAEEVYPAGYQTWVQVDEVSRPLEGARRPGHFQGVATVVAKLFNAFQPQRAYFGQKDAQQVAVVRRMTQDLDFPIEIVVCPTVREADGLAMSSRNAYLGPSERRAAAVLYRALETARQAFTSGERDADRLRGIMGDVLACEPLARPVYISAADPQTLQELSGQVDQALLSMAVQVGKPVLIDNIVIGDRRSVDGDEGLVISG
jgi:pantoate--beta-alanine ligase